MARGGKRTRVDAASLEHQGRSLRYFKIDLSRPAEDIDGLTEAECEVAQLVLRGDSNAAIAATRGTSPRTVANQLASIYRKRGISSRQELIRVLSEGRR